MIEPTPSRDLTRTFLAVICLAALVFTSLWILQPFLAPLIWATLLVIASWPTLRRFESWLGNKRSLAVIAMMGVLLLVFVIPFLMVLKVLVERTPDVVAWIHKLLREGLPPPPEWLAGLPMVGNRLTKAWAQLADAGPDGLSAHLTPYAEKLAAWFVSHAGGFGLLVLHFLLTLVLAAVLFAKGESFAQAVRRFARRLAGDRGDRAVLVAAQSVRAVAMGVVVTALVQAAVGGLGLVVAGVPAASLLTSVMFVAAIAQVGAAPVLALAAVWLFLHDSSGWGVFMIVWTVAVGSLDNVIRPIMIKKGVDLPLLLIFAGVIGGLIAFGPVGLFAGPVVLAVGHALLSAWIASGEELGTPTTSGIS
jgi:predicted PurR-regulated permease PerM